MQTHAHSSEHMHMDDELLGQLIQPEGVWGGAAITGTFNEHLMTD